MNLLSSDELKARLAGLQDGPWTERGALALTTLEKGNAFPFQISWDAPVNLVGLQLDKRALDLTGKLRTVLRWHEDQEITKPEEIRFRDSLDDALTYPQLLELAIETGYLPVDQIPADAKRYLISLLWSDPARTFVHTYGYIAVEYLAARLGIVGAARRQPPPVNQKAAILYSAFLATHRQLEEDNEVATWFAFLDDYVLKEGEQNDFYEFLVKRNGHPSARFATLMVGARSVVVTLSDFFRMTTPESRGQFGFFYAYWLAKLFGFKLGKRGYIRNTDFWGSRDDSWARALTIYFEGVAGAQGDAAAGSVAAALFRSAVDVLSVTWSDTREHLRLARAGPSGGQSGPGSRGTGSNGQRLSTKRSPKLPPDPVTR